MKNATFLFCAVCIMTAGSCKKDQVNKSQGLIGKWQMNAYYLSTGGPGYWTNIKDQQYVEFYKNGTIGGNAFNGYTQYIIKDSVNLYMKKSNDTTRYAYYYKINHDTLTVSPNWPIMCIEGCAVRFIRM